MAGVRWRRSISTLGGGALPQTDTLICQFQVRVKPDAPAGYARIFATSLTCAQANSDITSCQGEDGSVTVDGPQSMAVGYPWTMEDTLDLEILMPEEASESGITLDNGSRDPWQRLQRLGLLNGNRPTQLRRFMGRDTTASEAEYYRRHPHMAGARLHRLLVASFPNALLRDRALAELGASRAIERVTVRQVLSQRQTPPTGVPKRHANEATPAEKTTEMVYLQEHLDRLKARAAVELAGGWGLVAVVDTGIEREHPEFKSFTGLRSLTGTFVPGGNYLPYFAVNLAPASTQQDAGDVDEDQRSFVGDVPTTCEENGGPWLWPSHVGHGTHVAGLVAANGRDGEGVSGVCRDCGLAVLKASWYSCEGPENQLYTLKLEYAAGTQRAVDQGAQVVNLSGGLDELDCLVEDVGDTWCEAVQYALERDVFVAAASGNNRVDVQGPANSEQAIAVGGVDQLGAIWDRSPSLTQPFRQCPYWPNQNSMHLECGSNYSVTLGNEFGKQELMALANAVKSTVYTGRDWNPHIRIQCGDAFGQGSSSDGFGLCTGTSMSAPQVAGLVGLLRSINPLVRVGVADPSPEDLPGVRHLLVSTASRADAVPQWDRKLGYGEPNALAAVRGMLGTSNEELVRNRAIPLFSLRHGKGGNYDYAAVATPQLAMALDDRNYSSDGGLELAVPSYPAFPHGGKGQPRARAYMLSTEHRTMAMALASPLPLEPLYLMVKRDGNGNPQDHVLVTGSQNLEAAANANPPYVYAGRQGYVYRDCTGEPGCAPPVGTELLHLRCNTHGRCAVFPERDSTYFQDQGYQVKAPWMPHTRLGFAYSRGDSDGDGLPDAAEYVLGTDPQLADTDGDTVDDGVEYPFAELWVSDPCDGLQRQRCAPRELVFAAGFEG